MSAPVWTHVDRVGLTPFLNDSLDRVEDGPPFWSDDVKYIRGVQLARALSVAGLTGEVTITEPSPEQPLTLVQANAVVRGSDERAHAAHRLVLTTWLLSDGHRLEQSFQTESRGLGDTGAVPVLGVAAIAIVGGLTIGYVAHQAAQVIDRKLARDADHQKLVEVDATAVKLVKGHVEREAAAGKVLPLDAATKTALNSLGVAQKAIAEKQDKPLPALGEVDGALSGPLETFGDKFGDVAALAAGAALFIGGTYVVFKLMGE